VVVISGSVDEVRWRFAALGVKDFLPKPVDLDQLIGTLQAIVQRSFRTMVPTPPG
jgi:DNA-binding response OmpR family regulator